METYLVVWLGGYDIPQYKVCPTLTEAVEQAEEWLKDMQDGDQIDVLHIQGEEVARVDPSDLPERLSQ